MSYEDERPEEVDAEVVEEATVAEPGAPGSEVEVRPPGRDVLMPMDSSQVVEGMKAYQQLMVDLLEDSDWQVEGSKKFPKKSAWRKISRAFNLSLVKVSDQVFRDASGNPVRAEAVYRAIAPNGQVQDGDGYCSVDEKRFHSDAGRQKVEHDLRSTATTRAKNRAIADLVGMGEVSAEEIDAGAGSGEAALPEATKEQNSRVSKALCALMPEKEAEATYNEVAKMFGGKIPGPVADAISHVIDRAPKD